MAPARIVSLVPSTTESVCAFGASARLVGCTRYCTEPSELLRSVTRVGGTKNPDRETIQALAPDLILANGEENRAEDLEWLAQRAPVLVQTPRTVAAAAQHLRELAQHLGVEATAAPLLQRLAEVPTAPVPSAPPLRVYYTIWRKPWMSVNADTFVHDVLARAGAVNVCAREAERYPEVEPAAAVAAGVDVVLLASEPWQFDEAQRRELAASRTFGGARLVLCDGRDFCWHGVRMVDGLRRAAAVLAAAR
jgi:ABC-type Fe3+-hydroxamate transport system substrate-binding protein